MIWLLLLLVWFVAVAVAMAVLLALALRRASALGSEGDDWMAIADVISDEGHPDDCDCTDISLEGVTPEDQAVLHRNWMALTDDERDELNEAFEAIVEGADR